MHNFCTLIWCTGACMGTCRRQISLLNPSAPAKCREYFSLSGKKISHNKNQPEYLSLPGTFTVPCFLSCSYKAKCGIWILFAEMFFGVRCQVHQCVLFAKKAKTLSNFQNYFQIAHLKLLGNVEAKVIKNIFHLSLSFSVIHKHQSPEVSWISNLQFDTGPGDGFVTSSVQEKDTVDILVNYSGHKPYKIANANWQLDILSHAVPSSPTSQQAVYFCYS